ncbi:MAG: hypothetical protein IT436_09825 [Phycisphaerales bacterium]|nr:hypothetical protein [Phycisphaerales bacterium]
MSTKPLDLPPSIHPDMLQLAESDLTIGHDAGGSPVMDPAYAAAHGALARMHEAGTGLADAEAQLRERDGSRLAPSDALRLRTSTERTLSTLRKTVDTALGTIADRREAVEGEIAAALQLPEHRSSVVHASRAADVRAALRGMSPDDRADALHAAILAGDVEAVASVLSASPLASGLSRDDLKRLQTDAEHQFAPRLTALRTGLDKARDILARADDLTHTRFAGIVGQGDSAAGRAEAALRRAEVIAGGAA